MSFLTALLPIAGSIIGGLVGGGTGSAIGGSVGTALAGTGGGGTAPTLTDPTTGQPFGPTNINTPSLSFQGGTLTRTAPAFIPGQTGLTPTSGGVGEARTQIFGTPQPIGSNFNVGGFNQPGITQNDFLSGGTGLNISEIFGRQIGPLGQPGPPVPGGAAPAGGADPRLQEEQDVRRRLAELNPMLGEILAQIEASRGDVGRLDTATTQLGRDVSQFRQGLDIPTDLQPSADDLRALAALAAGADVAELERLGFDASALKDAAGNIDPSRLQQAIQIAEQLTGGPLTEAGIAALEAGGQLAASVQTQGAFETPLGALAMARGAAVSDEQGFNQLREDIRGFRETLAPQFNEALAASLADLEAQRASAAGDLSAQFAERRLSGSSFAADKITQSNIEFGRREDILRANFFQVATDAALQAFGIEGDLLNSQIGQRLSAATQRAAFAAEEAGILNTEIGRQLEQAGIITETGNRLAEIGLLQSEQDLQRATTIGEIVQNELNAELTQLALQGELVSLGADIASEAISSRLAQIQTSGDLTAQEASVLAQQAGLALSEAALNGDLFQIERTVLEQSARNIGLAMGLNEQQANQFALELSALQVDAALIQQTTTRELQELQIAGNIQNGILASSAEISAANADLAIKAAQARGQQQAGFVTALAPAVTAITSIFNQPDTPGAGGAAAP